jgi:predicted transcriptional regulator
MFSNLTHQFDLRRTCLAGRIGVGQSMLARLLAGELTRILSVAAGR